MNRRSKFTVIVAIYKIKHEKQKGELEINCLHYTLLIKRSMPWGQCCWIKSVQFQCHIATLSQNFSLFRVSGHHPKTCMTTHHTWTLSSTVQVREYVSLRTPLHVSSFVCGLLSHHAIENMLLRKHSLRLSSAKNWPGVNRKRFVRKVLPRTEGSAGYAASTEIQSGTRSGPTTGHFQ